MPSPIDSPLSPPADVPTRVTDLLHVRTAKDRGTFLITLSGELDIANAAKLDRVLREAAHSDATETVVDLTHLQFIDSTGLQLLILADRDARERDHRFLLLRGGGMVQRVFDVSGLTAAFSFAN